MSRMARPVGMKQRTPSRSNTSPTGLAGGTMGGKPSAATRRPGARQLQLGSEIYLWIMLLGEVILMGALRKKFRRYHGG